MQVDQTHTNITQSRVSIEEQSTELRYILAPNMNKTVIKKNLIRNVLLRSFFVFFQDSGIRVIHKIKESHVTIRPQTERRAETKGPNS